MAGSGFEKEFLQSHNTYRNKHGAQPLTISRELCRSAQAWAEHLLSIKTLQHSSGGKFGENLFYTWSSGGKSLTGREAVDSWYNEVKDYNYSRPGFTSGTGHFTQVVWKDTKELGYGVATDGKTVFVVGQYLPPGNFTNPGAFEKNVLPAGTPVDTKSNTSDKVDKAGQALGGLGNLTNKTEKGPSGGTGGSFEEEFLQTHNTYRKKHGAPPLTINHDLCRSAKSWAERLLSSKTLQHSNAEYGENLYYAWSSGGKSLTGHEAVDSWYNEIKDYNFSRPGFNSATGHFTQVVWKDTKELGYGVATDGKTVFVVGQYLPAGNFTNAGAFEKNVLPAGTPVDTKSNTSGLVDGVKEALGGLSIVPDKTPSGSAEKGPSGGKDSFEKEFLQTHNTYRNKHGAPPLTINHDLCRTAKSWAERLLSMKTLQHSKAEYGENLYYAWSSGGKSLTGREAVDSWYNEIKDYNFSRPGFSSATGHFTQVVWKDTKELGYGVATDGKTVFVVGQYLPAGNFTNAGAFEKNVLPAGTPVDTKSNTSGLVDGVKEALGGLSIVPDKTPSGSAEKGPSGGKDSFEKEFLQTHNTYRNKHGAPPLTINHDLCRTAKSWAERLLSMKTLQHSKAEYGENLYYAWSSGGKSLTGREAVDSWYNEIKDYNFSRPGFSSATGHFTQVVWKDTKELGYGVATDGKTVFVVGQYLPAGNFTNAGAFEKNVLPAGTPVDTKSNTSGLVDGVKEALGGLSIVPDKTPSGSAEKGPSGGKDSFEKEFLQTHNTYRNKHGAPPLTINHDLCRTAKSWAERLLSMKTLQHSKAEYGENLYYAWSSGGKSLTGREAVDSWYNEIKDYNFSRPGFSSATGHFTQVVWKDTKELGYGVATDGKTVFVVGQYLPPGNFTNAGAFEKNVLPAGTPVDTKSNTSGPADGAGGTSKKPTKTPSTGKDTFSSQLLEAINEYRECHKAPPLTHCTSLAEEAQEWAAHLVSINTLKTKTGHGQSMSYKWTSTKIPPTGQEIADSWYKERSKYNFSTPAFQSGAGNFTQMVWKSTERAGVGQATDGNGMFITVIFYEPAGNISSPAYFQKNVEPARS